MSNQANQVYDVLVLGGGLTGLAAAALLASRNHTVAVLESQARLGGRLALAPTADFQFGGGLLFNGPERGAVQRVLNTCGLYAKDDFIGSEARTNYMATLGRTFPQPLTPWLTWNNPYFKLGQRRAYYNLVTTANRSNPALVRGGNFSLADWLARHAPEPVSRALWLKFATLQTYNLNPLDLAAADFLENLQSSARNRYAGLYFKGGVGRLINNLQTTILAANPFNQIRTQAEVESLLIAEGKVKTIRLTSGEVLAARSVVCTLPPSVIIKLISFDIIAVEELAVAANLQGTTLLRLELGLQQKLVFATPTLFDLDHQVLLTDLSYYDASLTAIGTQLVQLLMFLPQTETLTQEVKAQAEQRLLKLADLYLKGWREVKAVERWTWEPMAVTAQHTLSQLNHLLPTQSRAVNNLFYAGDTVAAKGTLAELVFQTAEAAAIAADQFLN